MMHDQRHLSVEECHTKAAECRDTAKRAQNPEHRVMLEHMAETWDRICADLKSVMEAASRASDGEETKEASRL